MSSNPSGRRRSAFLGRAFSQSLNRDDVDGQDVAKPNILKKKKKQLGEDLRSLSSSSLRVDTASQPNERCATPSASTPQSPTPVDSPRSSLSRLKNRSSSILPMRSTSGNHDGPPNSTSYVPGSSSSTPGDEAMAQKDLKEVGKSRLALHHGEILTATGFRGRRREYLVLTETHLVRCKTQAKASEMFSSIEPNPRSTPSRASTGFQADIAQDQSSQHSDTSMDKTSSIRLEDIIAVYQVMRNGTLASVDVVYLDHEANQHSLLQFQAYDVESALFWINAIRETAKKPATRKNDAMREDIATYVARALEVDHDYDPDRFQVFNCFFKSQARGSHPTMAEPQVACLLVIGSRKLHLIYLPRQASRISDSMPNKLAENQVGGRGIRSFGFMSLEAVAVSDCDDNLRLAFRVPFNDSRIIFLASLWACEIALWLEQRDCSLRREWSRRPYTFEVPDSLKKTYYDPDPLDGDYEDFDKTLLAHCAAYGVDPSTIRYSVSHEGEDPPMFQLHRPTVQDGRSYTKFELLAVLRSLRYNESFASLSFARVYLDDLADAHDQYAHDYICTQRRDGTPLNVSTADQRKSSLLVQELRALAVTNRRLRRLEMSYCLSASSNQPDPKDREPLSCGIIEALFPLTADETNLDWITLNGTPLTEDDLTLLRYIGRDRINAYRAIEFDDCGLTTAGVAVAIDALQAQRDKLVSLVLANNRVRLLPTILDRHLSLFSCLRKIDLSNLLITDDPEAVIPFETIRRWRLEDLRLRGLSLNKQSVQALVRYMTDSNSDDLRLCVLSNCNLTGNSAADILVAAHREPGPRVMQLDLSDNRLQVQHASLAAAIATSHTPTVLTLRSLGYDNEEDFTELLLAISTNKRLTFLDVSDVSLPSAAGEKTCRAMSTLFEKNDTLESFDICGKKSRLEETCLGPGIADALRGLSNNKSLQELRIQNQDMGVNGAAAVADVIHNNRTLKRLYCDGNYFSISGITEIVTALSENTSLLYFSDPIDSRDAHLRDTETKARAARLEAGGSSKSFSKVATLKRVVHLGRTNSGDKDDAYMPPLLHQWTEDHMRDALKMVSDHWDIQMNKLHEYLHRNNRLLYESPSQDVVAGPTDESTQPAGETQAGETERTPLSRAFQRSETNPQYLPLDFGPSVDGEKTPTQELTEMFKSGSWDPSKGKEKGKMQEKIKEENIKEYGEPPV